MQWVHIRANSPVCDLGGDTVSSPEPDHDIPVLAYDTAEPCRRTPEELAEQWEYRQGPYFEEAAQLQHTRGVRESLKWVMGKRADAPVSGLALGRPPTRTEIGEEAGYAEEGMRGASPRGRSWHYKHGLGYLTGCENALTWAAGQRETDEWWGI